MADDDDRVEVPRGQYDAMNKHIQDEKKRCKAALRGARSAAEQSRAMGDLEGIEAMEQRVSREWKPK